MKAFFEPVARFGALRDESKAALTAVGKRLELPKRHVLVKADSVSTHIYFIEKGLARTYYYKDGRDVTDWLSAENDFVGSIVSFLVQRPDRRIVALLEPSVLWAFPHRGLEELYVKHSELERLGRLLTGWGFVQLQERFDDLHFATAAQRYETLLANHPTFIERVPLGIIASYLGITQETLSRIRAQV